MAYFAYACLSPPQPTSGTLVYIFFFFQFITKNATIIFAMSVYPFTYDNLRTAGGLFIKCYTGGVSLKYMHIFHLLKSDNETDDFTWRSTYVPAGHVNRNSPNIYRTKKYFEPNLYRKQNMQFMSDTCIPQISWFSLVYAMRTFPNLFSFTFREVRHPLNFVLVGDYTTEIRTGCLANEHSVIVTPTYSLKLKKIGLCQMHTIFLLSLEVKSNAWWLICILSPTEALGN